MKDINERNYENCNLCIVEMGEMEIQKSTTDHRMAVHYCMNYIPLLCVFK